MTAGRLERKGRVEITTLWLSGVSHVAQNTITTLLSLLLEVVMEIPGLLQQPLLNNNTLQNTPQSPLWKNKYSSY